MKEMKFRIFDNKYKEYLEEPDYRWMISRSGKLYNSENDEWYDKSERFIIEQFTGKIDSGGIEIYKGDKVTDGVAGLYEVDYDKDNCSFYLSYSSGMDSCEMMEYDDGVLEVVGNIH